MRISRGCYDKYRRCPGWAGGGWKYLKTDRCDNGSVPHRYYDTRYELTGWTCDVCKTYVLPRWMRYFDPTWWKYPTFYRPMWTYRFRWTGKGRP